MSKRTKVRLALGKERENLYKVKLRKVEQSRQLSVEVGHQQHDMSHK